MKRFQRVRFGRVNAQRMDSREWQSRLDTAGAGGARGGIGNRFQKHSRYHIRAFHVGAGVVERNCPGVGGKAGQRLTQAGLIAQIAGDGFEESFGTDLGR